jgi:hypothetical protein
MLQAVEASSFDASAHFLHRKSQCPIGLGGRRAGSLLKIRFAREHHRFVEKASMKLGCHCEYHIREIARRRKSAIFKCRFRQKFCVSEFRTLKSRRLWVQRSKIGVTVEDG